MVIKKSNNPFAGKAKPGVGKKKTSGKKSLLLLGCACAKC